MIRPLLVPLALLTLWLACPFGTVRAEKPARVDSTSRADQPPRKVIVGTAIYGPYGEYPGLDRRLNELCGIVDEMARRAPRQYPGRGLDLAILPETTATAASGSARQRALPLAGKVQETFSALAQAQDLCSHGPGHGRARAEGNCLLELSGPLRPSG